MSQISIKQCLIYATDKLRDKNITNPSLEARILLQYVASKSLEYLLKHEEEVLADNIMVQFEAVLLRRLKLEPIAYIVGIKEFYSYEFIVNKNILIPRADTELLVDVVIKAAETIRISSPRRRESIKNTKTFVRCIMDPRFRGDDSAGNKNNIKILELGTGSGCIAISLLLNLASIMVIATDISNEAIEVARSNAIKHHVHDRLIIVHSDWFTNLEKQKFDIIVSNPPYVSQDETSNMSFETLTYEPHLAIFADNNGIKSYEIIAQHAKNFLKPNGQLIIEIGYNQAERVSKIFTDHGYIVENIYKDLQQHPRTLEIKYKELNRSDVKRIGKHIQLIVIAKVKGTREFGVT